MSYSLCSAKDQTHSNYLALNRGTVCVYNGPISMPQFCPSEKQEEEKPLILVDRCDFLVVLSRLYKIRQRKEAQEEAQAQSEDDQQYDQKSLMKLFVHFSQSLMRREEFKLAVELFGYRDMELPPEFSQATIQTLRSSLEGRGQD